MKRATLILSLTLLPLLASCIEPEQPTEDPLIPYKQSLLPGRHRPPGRHPPLPPRRRPRRRRAHLTGRQQVLYTNNEGDKLDKIYFRFQRDDFGLGQARGESLTDACQRFLPGGWRPGLSRLVN